MERDKGIHFEKQFIVPVVIDDTGEPHVIGPRFKQLNYKRLPGGKVTPEFVKELEEIVSVSVSPRTARGSYCNDRCCPRRGCGA